MSTHISTRRRQHAAGNVGVEHAAPAAIQRAIATARQSQRGRKHFVREEFEALGLIAQWGRGHAKVLSVRALAET